MQYLGTNEIGYDRKALGFVSVKTCQAIVYQTAQALLGFHDAFCTDAQFERKLKNFAQYVQERSSSHKWHARCLIGVINRNQRFTGNEDWKKQLLQVASALNFDGAIWGARITDHLIEDDSAYIRFEAAEGQANGPSHCAVSYKSWKKMEFGEAKPNNDVLRTFVAYDPAFVPKTTEDLAIRPYALRAPMEDNRPVNRKGETGEGTLRPITTFECFRR